MTKVLTSSPEEVLPYLLSENLGTPDTIAAVANGKLFNVVMLVSYHGTNYAGFQKQPHAITVQGELEKAISKIANQQIDSVCAGRTDAGVHGTNQVINFLTEANRSEYGWLMGVNSQLPPDIRINQVYFQDGEFHSRFSAVARRYRYLLQIDKHKQANPHLFDLITTVKENLDLDLMNQAAQYLLGEQDFKSFQAAACQAKHSRRCIHHAYFKRYGELIVFDIQANAFLYHMVRNIMGALLAVGSNKLTTEQFKELIKAKNRSLAPATAPAQGLYLIEAIYTDRYQNIKANKLGPLFLPNQLD